MEMTRNEVEEMLLALRPTALREDMTERMEFALGIHDSLEESKRASDGVFQSIQPVVLNPEFQSRLLEIVARVPFRLNEKVVMFPAGAQTRPDLRKPHRAWLAAAACATIGGLAALFIPNQPERAQNIAAVLPVQDYPKNVRSGNIATTSFGSELEVAEDQGVIWTKDRQPMRVLRIEFQDRVLVRDEHGVERMLNLPREEVILIPEKLD